MKKLFRETLFLPRDWTQVMNEKEFSKLAVGLRASWGRARYSFLHLFISSFFFMLVPPSRQADFLSGHPTPTSYTRR